MLELNTSHGNIVKAAQKKNTLFFFREITSTVRKLIRHQTCFQNTFTLSQRKERNKAETPGEEKAEGGCS